MTAIPEPNHTLTNLVDKYHEAHQDKPRPHLGCSLLGHPCDRYLWLSLRLAVIERFSGRILRLFRRGQNEEQTVINDLRSVGISVTHTGGQQSRVDFGSHVSGSLDGIIGSGVPEAPFKSHVLEIKTHSQKSFDELSKLGVEKAKPQHWVQMQAYMYGKKIDRALYVAVCKNNDAMYTERVRLDKDVAEKYINRGRRIALSERIPEPLSLDPSWYQCKLCSAHEFCHKTKLTKEVNCRTCAHSTPTENSEWLCARHDNQAIPFEFQLDGCDRHVLHPDLVPWDRVESHSDCEAVYIIDGKEVRNGEPDAHIFGSKELVADPMACANADDVVDELRDIFDGRISS